MLTDFAQRPYFSPFEDCSKHNGKGYTVLRQLDETEVDAEVGDMFEVQFTDGEIIHAFQEELDGEYEGNQ